jgi:hypothetical protein
MECGAGPRSFVPARRPSRTPRTGRRPPRDRAGSPAPIGGPLWGHACRRGRSLSERADDAGTGGAAQPFWVPRGLRVRSGLHAWRVRGRNPTNALNNPGPACKRNWLAQPSRPLCPKLMQMPRSSKFTIAAGAQPRLAKKPLISPASASGCSRAAKCPPLGITLQRVMFVYVFSARERGGRRISLGNSA